MRTPCGCLSPSRNTSGHAGANAVCDVTREYSATVTWLSRVCSRFRWVQRLTCARAKARAGCRTAWVRERRSLARSLTRWRCAVASSPRRCEACRDPVLEIVGASARARARSVRCVGGVTFSVCGVGVGVRYSCMHGELCELEHRDVRERPLVVLEPL